MSKTRVTVQVSSHLQNNIQDCDDCGSQHCWVLSPPLLPCILSLLFLVSLYSSPSLLLPPLSPPSPLSLSSSVQETDRCWLPPKCQPLVTNSPSFFRLGWSEQTYCRQTTTTTCASFFRFCYYCLLRCLRVSKVLYDWSRAHVYVSACDILTVTSTECAADTYTTINATDPGNSKQQ